MSTASITPLSPTDRAQTLEISSEKPLPAKAALPIIELMYEQNRAELPQRGVYDGKANLYSPMKYAFGDRHEVRIS